MGKKWISLFLALVTVLALMGPVTVSADYENTYSNTGDQRADIIGVALTQVGYTEGTNNDTKYGDWMGLPNYPWCGIFVNWCARQAGVPTSVLAYNGIASPNSYGLSNYYTSDEYTPRSGDLFFKKDFSHVGLVYSVGETTFTTIEGNAGGSSYGDGVGVRMQTRSLDSYYFASPNYTTDSHHNYEQHYDDAHPHKEYYACTDCPSSYYTGNTVTLDDCTTCVQENCSHSYSDWAKTSVSKHGRSCTKCGKTESENHDWKTDKVTKEATCKEAGSQEQTCTVCKAQRTDTIPKTDDHDYGQWKYVTDDVHQRICDFCGYKDNQEHDIPEDTEVEVDEESVWLTDEKEHWLECETCGEDVKREAHDFGEDCVAPCEICAYVREEGHFYGEVLAYDENEHWRQCDVCEEESSREAHEFAAECAEKCENCDYTREVTHSYSETFMSDPEGHWYECSVCGDIPERLGHTPGPEATEDAAQVCLDCGWELAQKLPHVHDYSPIEYDDVSHFGTCKCGENLGPESHMWDMSTGKCSVCGLPVPVQETEQQNWDFVWYIAAGVLVAAVSAVVIVLSVKKKKSEEV